MAKVLLTTAGTEVKLDELFALGQPELDAQAMAVATDFIGWINDNFELSAQEQNYLVSADEDFMRLLSSIVFVAVRNRLPVNFTKSPITLAVKRFETTSSFNFDYQWGGVLEKTSNIKLNIVYL